MVLGSGFKVQRLQLLETADYMDQDPEYPNHPWVKRLNRIDDDRIL